LFVEPVPIRGTCSGRGSVVEAGPGDFVHVPAQAVHRESNPTDRAATAIIARGGMGVPTVNVDAPGDA